ncbi:hypothetical protein [Schinkia azotoformans]|nr:hypothetical protein [Schinkia azotoformans]MEC1722554.1 hypothetical protein [Schinkia azotoformans]MED4411555.1 hypothetical protein [Schinkia azotoformans]
MTNQEKRFVFLFVKHHVQTSLQILTVLDLFYKNVENCRERGWLG